MYSRILLATDFSDASIEAGRLAIRLAQPDAEVHALHVLPALPPMDHLVGSRRHAPGERMGQIERDATEALAGYVRLVGAPKARQTVTRGGIARTIAHEAAQMRADLVALGAKGMSRVQRVLLGSSARAIVRGLQADTLVVRGNAPPPAAPPLRHVVAATDFYAPASAAARRARELTQQTGARLTAFHAVDPTLWAQAAREVHTPEATPVGEAWLDEALGDMLHAFNQEVLGGEAEEALRHGRPGHALAAFAAQTGADLVVAGSHGAGRLERWLLGSGAESIVEAAPCSVLVVHAPSTAHA